MVPWVRTAGAAEGGARAGLLFGSEATPACLLLSRSGAVPFHTPWQLAEDSGAPPSQHQPSEEGARAGGGSTGATHYPTHPHLVHVCALDLWGKPGAGVLRRFHEEGGPQDGGTQAPAQMSALVAAKQAGAEKGAVAAAQGRAAVAGCGLAQFCGLGTHRTLLSSERVGQLAYPGTASAVSAGTGSASSSRSPPYL
jgi:hypothetical protein